MKIGSEVSLLAIDSPAQGAQDAQGLDLTEDLVKGPYYSNSCTITIFSSCILQISLRGNFQLLRK